jgi:hypothetical protein
LKQISAILIGIGQSIVPEHKKRPFRNRAGFEIPFDITGFIRKSNTIFSGHSEIFPLKS